MEEIWKKWPTAPDYEVSDEGRVRRGDRILSIRLGTGRTIDEGQAYSSVAVIVNGKRKTVRVHRMVCDAHIGPLPSGMHRAHLNNDALDNRLANLAIVSARENTRLHAIEAGQSPDMLPYKLSSEDIAEIVRLYRDVPGMTRKELGRRFGVDSKSTIEHHLKRAGLVLKRGKLSNEQRAECVRRLISGESGPRIARDYNITPARVYQLAREAAHG